jgi:hypothetical protein
MGNAQAVELKPTVVQAALGLREAKRSRKRPLVR